MITRIPSVSLAEWQGVLRSTLKFNALTFDPQYFDVLDTGMMTMVTRSQQAEEPEWTLSHTINRSTGVVSITAGRWVRMGLPVITISAGDVTLTGTPEYVWVKLARSTSTCSLGHSTNDPTTIDSANAYVVLVSFTATGGAYDVGTIHHKGDIYFDLPLI